MTSRAEAERVLARYWGFAKLHDAQWEAIEAVLDGRDVLSIMPTGGGKSLCYQLPAVMRGGVTMVITPLIALMQDQVRRLQLLDIPAAFLHSGMSAPEIDRTWADVEAGRILLLYVAPERLQSEMFLARAPRLPISLLAIDEAHCVSDWGHDFRPSYLRIPECYELLGHPPIVATTATATPQVRSDLGRLLGLRSPAVFVRGFDRPNLTWTVYRDSQKKARVLDLVAALDGAGILYAASRHAAQSWCEWLEGQGHPAFTYHGGMTPEARRTVQDRWCAGERRLMVATSAFGMGIDRPDVRFVVHVDLPASLEAYYQEAGRAGRDGGPARAILLVDEKDEMRARSLVREMHPGERDVRAVYDAVADVAHVAPGAQASEMIRVDVAAVARQVGLTGAGVRAALDVLEQHGLVQRIRSRPHTARLRMRTSPENVRHYAESVKNRALARFVDELVRIIPPEAFQGWWDLNLRQASKRTGVEEDRLCRGLDFLAQRQILEWDRPAGETCIRLMGPRVRSVEVEGARRALRRAEAGVKDMIRYARGVSCRRRFLLNYMGEDAPARCGNCDVCLGLSTELVVTPADEPDLREILEMVAQGMPREGWPEPFARNMARTDVLLDWLVQEAFLDPEDPLEGTFSLTEKALRFREQWQPRHP